jgi:flagellar hook-associated protein 2
MSSTSSVSTTPAIGTSVINVPALVSQLMATEQYPITALQTATTAYQAKLTAFGQIQSAVSTFQTALSSLNSASSFQAVTAATSDPTVLSATALTSAAPGSYSLIVGNLAQAQNLVAAGQTSLSAPIGTGAATTLSFDFGTITGTATNGTYGAGTTFASAGNGIKTVTINSTNNSLQGMRDAINAAGIGVTASIINDGSATPYRLVLTSAATGAANSMTIAVAGDAAVSSLLAYNPTSTTGQNLNQSLAALNANLTVNGISVSKPSNTMSDIIPGVTVNLTKPSATPVTLTVAPDTATVTKNVNGFVTAYNALKTTLTSLTAYSASTKTAAILQGNLAILNMQSDLNGIMNKPATGAGSLNSMAQIGVTFQRDGTLAVNGAMLSTALKNNFSSVAGLFAATGSATDSLITYNTYNSSTQPGTYPVNITQLATQGNETGTAAPNLTITAGTNDTLNMNINGTNATVTLPPGTYASTQALAAALQAQINGSSVLSAAGVSVSATVNAGNISVTSNTYGSTSSVIATGGNGMSNIFGTAVSTQGVDVAGTINGIAATGIGQLLTSASGNSQGVSMVVAGGLLGARGTVSYSQGYAYTLNNYASSLLSSSGSLTSSTNEINTNISQVAKQITALQQGLVTKQALYTAQYTALNNMMTSMNSTSAFLTQQLSKL